MSSRRYFDVLTCVHKLSVCFGKGAEKLNLYLNVVLGREVDRRLRLGRVADERANDLDVLEDEVPVQRWSGRMRRIIRL